MSVSTLVLSIVVAILLAKAVAVVLGLLMYGLGTLLLGKPKEVPVVPRRHW